MRVEMISHPCILRGLPMAGALSKIKIWPQQKGTKSQRVASVLPSRETKRGRTWYVTIAF